MRLSRKEWFRMFPKEISDKAFKNVESTIGKESILDYEKYLDMEYNSALECLMSSFPFYLAPEGVDYWVKAMREATKVDRLAALTDHKTISLN